MSVPYEARLAIMRRAFQAADPGVDDQTAQNMAEQVVRIFDARSAKGWDLRLARLAVHGVKKTPLGTWLRQLRESAGFTQHRVSREFEWHDAKVTRIETGVVPVTTSDLRHLLDFYGVRDLETRNSIALLAREDRQAREDRRRRNGSSAA